MAGTKPISQSEYDQWASRPLQKTPMGPAFMRNRDPLKVPKLATAKVKVKADERAAYDRCAAAMLAGDIYAWSIDEKTGKWLVRILESDEWVELDRSEVVEMLDTMGAPGTAKVERPAVTVEPEVAQVAREELAALAADDGTTWPDRVVEYVARLVFAPKRAYAVEYAAHLLDGEPVPADPGTEWAVKVRVKLDKMTAKVAA